MTTNDSYQIWITFNGEKQKIRIPVLPESFSVSMGTKDQSVDIIGLGEILIAQNPVATEFSFSSFFPVNSFPGISDELIVEPKTLRDTIADWKNTTQPVHLIVTGVGIDFYCRISKFKPVEKGGDVGTIYYDIAFKEYRDVSVRKVNVNEITGKATVSKKTTRTDNTTRPKTYKVKEDDCLWDIAQAIYGDPYKYIDIYNANRDLIGGNPNLIFEGQTFVIP